MINVFKELHMKYETFGKKKKKKKSKLVEWCTQKKTDDLGFINEGQNLHPFD